VKLAFNPFASSLVDRPRRLARALRRRLASDAGPGPAGPTLIDAFAETYPDAVFVEIGSNDGEQHDFLRAHILSRNWTGVMVEPVPYVFERLARNYRHVDRVALENSAVADRDGVLPFFHLAQADEGERAMLPPWYDGIGSLSRDAVVSHADKVPNLERRLTRLEVPCLTFSSLCRRHGLATVDLLLIDAEGSDRELLRHVDLGTFAPRLVIYEHFHLSPEDRAACRSEIEAHGYETMEEGFDTFCLRAGTPDELSRVWSTLRPAPGLYVEDGL